MPSYTSRRPVSDEEKTILKNMWKKLKKRVNKFVMSRHPKKISTVIEIFRKVTPYKRVGYDGIKFAMFIFLFLMSQSRTWNSPAARKIKRYRWLRFIDYMSVHFAKQKIFYIRLFNCQKNVPLGLLGKETPRDFFWCRYLLCSRYAV